MINHTIEALRLISKPSSLNLMFGTVHNELSKNKNKNKISLRKNKHYQPTGIYGLDGKLTYKFKNNLVLAKHLSISNDASHTLGKSLNSGLVYKKYTVLKWKTYNICSESELVSGFMTEHAAVIFVFFFLAEYASIVLISILTSILFLGGYLLNFTSLLYLIKAIDLYLYLSIIDNGYETLFSDPLIEGMIYGLTLGFKACVMIFVFIWVRASFPRIRYDQLMSFCWTVLLPLVIAFIILLPCILYSFEIIPTNVSLL